jgi:hypothetical protein
MDSQAATVRLFGPMNENVYDAARLHQIPCTVGLTKYYQGWHRLYLRLTRGGKFRLGIELDYSEYDGSITLREMERVANVRYGMLVAILQDAYIQDAIRDCYSEIIHTKILFGSGDLVQKHTGNPSGQPNTIVDNSMVNEFRWYYCWVIIMPIEFHSLAAFREHCELITCGDDSLIAVSDFAQTIFTPAAIFSVFSAHGWKPKLVRKDTNRFINFLIAVNRLSGCMVMLCQLPTTTKSF